MVRGQAKTECKLIKSGEWFSWGSIPHTPTRQTAVIHQSNISAEGVEKMDSEALALLQPYCKDDMKLLKSISRSIFLKFNEQISTADYDDFYSIANMTLWQACNSYKPDMGISFDGFLKSCLKKKFATEIRDRHRKKRILNQLSISLNESNDDDGDFTLLDSIASDIDTFTEVIERQGKEQYTNKVQQYISNLTNQQINILNLLIDGYKPNEIRRILEISSTEYTSNMQIMRSYEKVKILF